MFLKFFLSYFLLYIFILVSVAFFTLMERKVLSSMGLRVGPQYVGYWGLFQSFSDAVKLLSKESWMPSVSSYFVFYFSPILSMTLVLFIWLIFPFFSGFCWLFGILFFFCISSLNVYPILSSGWSSNCKYTMLGSLRSVAQMVSYEISLVLILLSLVFLSMSYNLYIVLINQAMVYNFILVFCLGMIWFITCLAETNRTPYDFSEGESELVSGFNTEYMGGGFTLIFLSEYASIMFMSVMSVILLFGGSVNFIFILKILIVGYLFIWVRATLPRYRYDKLMNLAWKSLLPWTLVFLILLMGFVYYIV